MGASASASATVPLPPTIDEGAAYKRRKANNGGSADVAVIDEKTRPVGKEFASFQVYYPSFARHIFGACGSTGAIKALLCNSLDAGASVISLRQVTEKDKCPIPGTHWVIRDDGEGCSSTTFEKGLFYLGAPGRKPLGHYGTGMQVGSMYVAPRCLVASRHLSAPGATLVALLTADHTTDRHTTYGVWTQIGDDATQTENGFLDAIAKETSTPTSALLAFLRNAVSTPRGTALFLLDVYNSNAEQRADLKTSLLSLRMPCKDSRFAHVAISIFDEEQKSAAAVAGLAVTLAASDLPPPLQPVDTKESSYTAYVMDAPPGQDSCIRWYWNGIFVTQTAVPGPMKRQRVLCVSIDPWDMTRDDRKTKGCSVNPDKCDILASEDWIELQSKAVHILSTRFG